jgi:copper resistance protein D
MSLEIYLILKGFHILLAIIWVGGLLFVGWGVYPAVNILKLTEQRLFLRTLMQRSHWLFTLAGVGVITTGSLLGTIFGPIRSWHALWNTTYGNIWFTALIVGIVTLAWGVFVGYKRTMMVLSADSLWELAEKGDSKPLNKALVITAVLESIEVIGFIVLLVLMLLLR